MVRTPAGPRRHSAFKMLTAALQEVHLYASGLGLTHTGAVSSSLPRRPARRDEAAGSPQSRVDRKAGKRARTARSAASEHGREIWRQRITGPHEALRDEGTKAKAFELIRTLVDRIVLRPEHGEGGMRLAIDLEGDLAGILRRASKGGTPSGRGVKTQLVDFIDVIKLVAGARNQRLLGIAESRIPKLAA